MTSHSDSEVAVTCNHRLSAVKFKAKERLMKKDFLQAIRAKRSPEIEELRLLTAVQTNNTEEVERLLKSGVNPNSSDRTCRSALHLAASRGYVEVARLLLKHGADSNRKDIIQNTPLHLAACNSNLPIIKTLIDGGADISSLDLHGRNPLQLVESKLLILRRCWKSGTIGTKQVCTQVQEIFDIMISLWRRKQSPAQHDNQDIDGLNVMKLSLEPGQEDTVDDQMGKLLSELQQFSIN